MNAAAVPAPQPPPRAWQPVPGVPGLYSHEHPTAEGWNLRTTAVALRDGGVALVSPTRGLDAGVLVELDALGPTRALLAPNHFHHLGLREHLTRAPDARVVASSTAARRIAAKTGLALAGLDALRELLPPHASVLEPPGLRSGEVWLQVRGPDATAWVVTDAFFNALTTPPGAIGLFLRATGTAPGLRVGSTFKWLALADARVYRPWVLDALRAQPPTVLVPAHGDVLADRALATRLAALVEARL